MSDPSSHRTYFSSLVTRHSSLLYNPILHALLAFALFLAGLGAIGLVGPDEPRYADVARAMLRSGDYVTPRLFGAPWFEKPPLYYWLAASFFRLGANELTARLPSAVSAIAFLGVWFWFAQRLFGGPTALLAAILLASSLGWIGFARAAAMDMLLAATLDAALLLLALWFWERQTVRLYGFYALLGLATLAKGPVAVALAGMIALGYIVNFREWAALKNLLWTPAVAAFLAVAAPWYAVCYFQNGFPFLEEFFLKHNLERLVSADALGHGQPIWYYVPILAAGLFPWSAMLLLPAVEVIRGGLRAILSDRRKAFLFYWVALPFAFFSVSQNKLPGYLLPILPPLTLWIAAIAMSGSATKTSEPTERNSKETTRPDPLLARLVPWLAGLSAVALLSVPVLAPLLSESLATGLRHALAEWNGAVVWAQISKGPVPAPVWVVLVGLIALSLYLLSRKQVLEGAFAALLGVAVSMLVITTYLSPSINRVASMRSVAQRIASLGVPGEAVAVYRIHRNQALQLGFYLDHALPEWSPEGGNSEISLVVAGQDEQITLAHPASLFPGQRVRLWELIGIRIETEPPPAP